ncbi:FAD-dependent oxidoreductase [Burkholderia sp. AW49-1]
MPDHYDICIVGAGIGGLTCATRLIDSPVSQNLDIRVFDLNVKIGGRIQSKKLDSKEITELGAARYSPQLHPHFQQLMQSCGHHHDVYPFTESVFHDNRQENLRATLLGLMPMLKAHTEDSFFDFASHYLGSGEAMRIVKAMGYDALLLPIISAPMAYDIIKKHPETQSLIDNPANQWLYATEGYSQLLAQLQRQAQAGRVKFQMEHRLVRDCHANTRPAAIADSMEQCLHILLVTDAA